MFKLLRCLLLLEDILQQLPGCREVARSQALGLAGDRLARNLVDEALLAIFPDATPSILEFFQADARRHAEFRVGSSCGFSYAGVTRIEASASTIHGSGFPALT